MQRNFDHRRAAFEELACLVKDNRNLIWLSQTEAESFHALDPAYVIHVQKLLRVIAAIGVRQDGGGGAFTIVYGRHGTAWSKDYVYREDIDPESHHSLASGRPGGTIERPIAKNWALRLERFE